MQLLKTIVLVTLFASPVVANNVYFLPGDAFFFARLDLETIQGFEDEKSPVVSYGSRSNGAMGCGYIGYEKIQLQNMNADVKTSLTEAYRKFETEINRKAKINGKKMNVFVYSHDYDWKERGIGIQYNENWVDESVAFGTMREHATLGNFGTQSLMLNWRDSKLVSSLNATCPELPADHGKTGITDELTGKAELFPTPWGKTPVKIESSKCCYLIIPNREFDNYDNNLPNGIEVIEIADGTLTHFKRENHTWRRVETGE